MNEILSGILLGKDLLALPESDQNNQSAKQASDAAVGSVLNSFESLGYILDPSSIEKIRTLPEDVLTEFYNSGFSVLSAAKGANVKHVVMYKNFPNEVLSLSNGELMIRATLHYLSVFFKDVGVSNYVFSNQDLVELKRLPFDENFKPTVLGVVSQDKATEIIIQYAKNVLGGSIALTDKTKAEIEAIRKEIPDADSKMHPESFKFKETLAYWVKLMCSVYGVGYVFSHDSKVIDFDKMTATDILRVCGIVSNDDIDAAFTAANFRYRSFPRASRKFIVGLVNSLCVRSEILGTYDLLEDEFGKHNFKWNCLFKMLHVGDYANTFPAAYAIAKDCRSHNGCKTIDSKLNDILVNAPISNKDKATEICDLLSKKPGVFARKLDWLLRDDRLSGCSNIIVESFMNCAKDISVNVLIQLYNHFINRQNPSGVRIFSYELNGASRIYKVDDTRKPISKDDIQLMLSGIYKTLSEKEYSHPVPDGIPLSGKVYVSPIFKQFAIPESARTSSSSCKTITRGSKLHLGANEDGIKTIRVFTHWHNLAEKDYLRGNRVDIDLSAQFFDKNLTEINSVSWNTGLRGFGWDDSLSKDMYACHSGDITDAPNGATEYIDIGIKEAKDAGVKYVVIMDNLYCGSAWKDIPECFSGIMLRKSKFGENTGEIFDPKTVALKFGMTQNINDQLTVLAYDFEKDEFIWIDAPVGGIANSRVASESVSTIETILRESLEQKLSMYDLIMMGSAKFSAVVDDPNQADVIFGDESTKSDNPNVKRISPYDIDEFVKLFL
jgi:hypothetical protein